MVQNKSMTRSFNYQKNPIEMDNRERNLRKSDLGGVIFGCKHDTIAECHSKQLFGLPSQHFTYVKNIEQGLPLFLFNYSDRKMHGLYEAAGAGGLNVDTYAWTDMGSYKTPFPAQVPILIKANCYPLEEKEFKNAILDNYYEKTKFWFELDHAQTRALTSLFKKCPFPTNLRPPPVVLSFAEAVRRPVDKTESSKNNLDLNLDRSEEEIVSDWEVLADDSNSSNSNLSLNSNSNLNSKEEAEKERVLGILKEIKENRLKKKDDFEEGKVKVEGAELESHEENRDLKDDKGETANSSSTERDEMLKSIIELTKRMHWLETNQTKKDREIERLKQTLDQSELRLTRLNSQLLKLESQSSPKTQPPKTQPPNSQPPKIQLPKIQPPISKPPKPQPSPSSPYSDSETSNPNSISTNSLRHFVEQCLGTEDVIYLLGGNDGNSFLNNFESFSPSLDILTPLRPMSCARSYMGVATLDGRIFAVGGYDCDSWFDIVECYDRRNDEWVRQVSLSRERGCLAAVSINGKIYAIGGKDNSEYFKEVEKFDPVLGKWMSFLPMLEKRSSLGAVSLNGSIYAVGGYDGDKYLCSGERIDLREPYWKQIPNMSTRRGTHSLAVFNDKLYAVGGYNGSKPVSTVECFDPRKPTWVMSEPICCGRGYVATCVVGGSLYAIGGTDERDSTVDIVECYQEGRGWINTGLKAIGKRCCNAIAF
ncbi:hypothetical protein LUZ60_015388 [Juncus effusus]|nr:hypothetical protein LUZ60_015388 [Juncus effusus]